MQAGSAGPRPAELERFARLPPTDLAVLEATGNTADIVCVSRRRVTRVGIANRLRLIAEARARTHKTDVVVLAWLDAGNLLPEVWMLDEGAQTMRRQDYRRSQPVRQRTRLRDEIRGVLAASLIEQCPASDLPGKKRRLRLGDA